GRPKNRNMHLRDTTVAHSGRASAKILWRDPIAGENKAPMQYSRYGLPVEGGASLLVSGFYRTEGKHSVRVGVNTYAKDKTYLGLLNVGDFPASDQWRLFEKQVQLSDKVSTIGFVLYGRQGGASWFDDIAVIGTPGMEAARATPKLDGRLDEPCWNPARAVTTFVKYTGDALAREKTKTWIAFDDDNLYVAFECPHPANPKLKLDATRRDGDTWLDDSVEVFLDPGHTHDDYLQFCVNALGHIRDSHRHDPAWNSTATAATHRRNDRWTVEIRIPLADLQLGFTTGETWGINLVRNDRVNGETVTWSLGGIHDATRFGNVKLPGADFTAYLGPALLRRGKEVAAEFATTWEKLTANELPKATVEAGDVTLRKARASHAEIQRLVANGIRSRQNALEIHSQIETLRENLRELRTFAVRHAITPPNEAPFSVVIADSMDKILPHDDFSALTPRTRVSLDVARDESESFQLVVIADSAALANVRVETTPLISAAGAELTLAWHPIGWVRTGKPSYATRHVGRWPDVLLPPADFAVPKGECRPVWFRLDVPAEARPGLYTGSVTIQAAGDATTVPVEYRVRSFRLPRPGTLVCPFGIYAHIVSKYYYGKGNYADLMPIEKYAKFCEFLGRYRISPKNIANEYLRGDKDGFDLSALKTTITPFADTYFPPNSFSLYRLPCPREWQTGKPERIKPEAQYERLRAKHAAYRALGLPGRAYIYGVDEPHPDGYAFIRGVYEEVRKIAPGFPIMQTINHRPPEQLFGVVDIWCALTQRYAESADFYQARRAAGDQLWLYVCCGPKPPYANFFIDKPGASHRVLFWQTWEAGATGLLYWCMTWWEGLPGPASGKPHFPEITPSFDGQLVTGARYRVNGDGLLAWPGPDMTPWPSQRLEIIRDGIEDYEYLALLRSLLDDGPSTKTDTPLRAQARRLLIVPDGISKSFTEFTSDPQTVRTRRREIADMIEKLTE
ncbi:MAG: DUF4091 domain-containing protein, partial [Lentisphaeria bacterium]|nr:DUF4091 domain-containing protein [Lentisphaeria bacterium]